MKAFLFIHGKNPELSKYEIRSIYGKQVEYQNEWFSVVSHDDDIAQSDMDRLGGTIKICEVFSEDPVDVIMHNSQNEKVVFGLSQYAGHDRLSGVLLGIKRKLKSRGRNARFVNKDFSNVSSGQLNKSHLLEKGVDLVRCFYEKKEVWAKTLVFQDIDSYSTRDYDKPKRDMKVGMMPPKLCQMMINFSQADLQTTTLYDPFCGLGTNLMEAALMGYQIAGSDIKGRLIDSTLRNLEWLEKTFEKHFSLNKNLFFQHDVTQEFPKKKLPENLAVVTESYLGPALSGFPDKNNQESIFTTLHQINGAFFSHIRPFIPSGNRLVMCLPYFRTGKQQVFYPEEHVRTYEQKGFILENDLRSLLYERKNQVVGREVMVFKKH